MKSWDGKFRHQLLTIFHCYQNLRLSSQVIFLDHRFHSRSLFWIYARSIIINNSISAALYLLQDLTHLFVLMIFCIRAFHAGPFCPFFPNSSIFIPDFRVNPHCLVHISSRIFFMLYSFASCWNKLNVTKRIFFRN